MRAYPFELPLRVEPADVDELGHVNNVVYVRWIQDVAAAHWLSLTTREARARTAWVVLRHEIDYKSPAREGEAVVARTHAQVASAATCERHTQIVRAGDSLLLAQARTLWCAVDPATGRARRIPPEIRELFPSEAAAP